MARKDDTQAPDLDSEDGDGLSVTDAASRIEGLLSDDDLGISQGSSAAKPRKAKSSKPASKDEDDEDSHIDEEDLDDEDLDDSHEDSEDDDEDDADEVDEDLDDEDEDADENDAEDDEPAPLNPKLNLKAKVTVKVDGEDEEVTLGEALAGFSRTSSFTKKSQKLAEDRRAHEATVSAREAEIVAAQEHYVTQLSALEAALSSQEPDWDKVRSENPEQFAELHAAWSIHQKRLDTIRAERDVESQKLSQKFQENRTKLLTAERAKLVTAIPEWGDKTEKGKSLRKAVHEFGLSTGFSEDEMNGTVDHRAYVILHKAYLFDKAQADRKAALKAGKKKVEKLQSLRSGAKPAKGARHKSKAAQAAARSKKTGNVRDVAAAIEALLD